MAGGVRVGLVLLVVGVGCGRSVRHDGDGESGGASGETTGGTGAVTGGRGGTAGGSTTGGGTTGGTSGGGSDAGGAGGETASSTRLFFQANGALVSTDLEGGSAREHCADAPSAQYSLAARDGERAIVLRRNGASSGTATLLRVALDGSECAPFHEGAISYVLSTVAEGRVVFGTTPVFPTTELAIPAATSGLASVRVDGSGYTQLAPNAVTHASFSAERLIVAENTATGTDLVAERPDGSERAALLPNAGVKNVAFVRGRVVIVNVAGEDVLAVNDDGSGLVELATGAERDAAVGLAGEHVVIRRTPGVEGGQTDLYTVPLAGGALVPLTATTDYEEFAAATSDRVVYTVVRVGGESELVSTRVDGSDPRPVLTPENENGGFVGLAGDRIVFLRAELVGTTTRTAYFSANLDGTDAVTVHENASGFMAIVGDRVVLSVGASNRDLVSARVLGGPSVILADAPQAEFVMGRLGSALIVQQGGLDATGDVTRVEVDGSVRNPLMTRARYVGAVTETCGAVPAGDFWFQRCPDE